jgi:hypothetical protein
MLETSNESTRFLRNGEHNSTLISSSLMELLKGIQEWQGEKGVILYPKGIYIHTHIYIYAYSLNLGISSNNHVESYALLQGLNLSKTLLNSSLIVVWDSKIFY